MHSRRMSLLQPSGRDDVQVAPVGRPYTVYFPDTLKTTKDMTSVSRLLVGPSTSWGKNSPGSRGGEGAGGEVGSHVWQHFFQISLYVNLSLAPRNAFKTLSGMYCYWKSPTHSQVAASSQLTTHIVTWPQSLVASIESSLITCSYLCLFLILQTWKIWWSVNDCESAYSGFVQGIQLWRASCNHLKQGLKLGLYTAPLLEASRNMIKRCVTSLPHEKGRQWRTSRSKSQRKVWMVEFQLQYHAYTTPVTEDKDIYYPGNKISAWVIDWEVKVNSYWPTVFRSINRDTNDEANIQRPWHNKLGKLIFKNNLLLAIQC